MAISKDQEEEAKASSVHKPVLTAGEPAVKKVSKNQDTPKGEHE